MQKSFHHVLSSDDQTAIANSLRAVAAFFAALVVVSVLLSFPQSAVSDETLAQEARYDATPGSCIGMPL